MPLQIGHPLFQIFGERAAEGKILFAPDEQGGHRDMRFLVGRRVAQGQTILFSWIILRLDGISSE